MSTRLQQRLQRLEQRADADDFPEFQIVLVSTDGTPDKILREVDGKWVEVDYDEADNDEPT